MPSLFLSWSRKTSISALWGRDWKKSRITPNTYSEWPSTDTTRWRGGGRGGTLGLQLLDGNRVAGTMSRAFVCAIAPPDCGKCMLKGVGACFARSAGGEPAGRGPPGLRGLGSAASRRLVCPVTTRRDARIDGSGERDGIATPPAPDSAGNRQSRCKF